ncbi:MAG: VOC family protein [Psychroserpens sp.]|nr:VOC family protein [Psychroserpens sp.]
MKTTNNHINYIEFKTRDIEETKAFYTAVFNWTFTDYGPHYTSFSNSGIDGGFEKTDTVISNGALIVIQHKNLEKTRQKIIDLGGTITVETFSFPGGKRFQFLDPSGNELAVWCELDN